MLAAVLVVAALGVTGGPGAVSASHTRIFLSESSTSAIPAPAVTLAPGERLDLYVWAEGVDNATGAAGFTLTLTFDETKLTVSTAPGDSDGIGDSTWLDASRPGAFCLLDPGTPLPGRIVGTCVSLGTLPGSVGTGLLGHLVVQAGMDVGASVLAFVEPAFGVLSTHIVSASKDPVAIPAALLLTTVSIVEAPPPAQTGDVSCDGVVNPLDAALILQFSAGLLSELPCPAAGDANTDGATNPLDAALVLQVSAGLLDSLPP